MADVEEKLVCRGIEDVVHGQRQLDDAKVGSEVAAGLRQAADQQFADLLRQLGKLPDRHALDVRGRLNGTEMFAHRGNHVLDAAHRKNDPAYRLGRRVIALPQV